MSVVWLWSGAVTHISARVVTKVTDAGLLDDNVRLAVADNEGMSGPVFYTADSIDSTLVAQFTATGLDPDTQYWYQVEDNGTIDTSITGQFHTFGIPGEPYIFAFIASGDAGLNPDFPGATGTELAPTRISNHPAFDEIRRGEQLRFDEERRTVPLWVAHMGDMNYYNFGDGTFVPDASVGTYRRAIDDIMLQPNQAALYRDVPLVWMYDDHDGGPNDWDGTFVDKANGVQVYRERVPHYPLEQATGATYHSFQCGRVLYVVTDGRYDRDAPGAPEPRTYLGAGQKAWLENLLTTSTASFLIWQSAQPINSPGTTSWGSYDTERQELFTMLADLGWNDKMVMLSADQHWMGLDLGSNTGGFPLFTLAPIDANPTTGAGTSYDQGVNTGARGQYGTATVLDWGKTIRVDVRGWTF